MERTAPSDAVLGGSDRIRTDNFSLRQGLMSNKPLTAVGRFGPADRSNSPISAERHRGSERADSRKPRQAEAIACVLLCSSRRGGPWSLLACGDRRDRMPAAEGVPALEEAVRWHSGIARRSRLWRRVRWCGGDLPLAIGSTGRCRRRVVASDADRCISRASSIHECWEAGEVATRGPLVQSARRSRSRCARSHDQRGDVVAAGRRSGICIAVRCVGGEVRQVAHAQLDSGIADREA